MDFCAYLVLVGWYETVSLSFLITSHTHEDVDQCFANIRKALHDFNVRTAAEYAEVVHKIHSGGYLTKNGHSRSYNVYPLDLCFNWMAFFHPHTDTLTEFHDFHGIKFENATDDLGNKNVSLAATFLWSPQPQWSAPICIFNSLPAEAPQCRVPAYMTLDVDKLRATIRSCSTRLEPDQLKWWTGFLDQPSSVVLPEPPADLLVCFLKNKTSTFYFHPK
jgi:hypothetical protein